MIHIEPGDAAYDELNTLPMVLYDNLLTDTSVTGSGVGVEAITDQNTATLWTPGVANPSFSVTADDGVELVTNGGPFTDTTGWSPNDTGAVSVSPFQELKIDRTALGVTVGFDLAQFNLSLDAGETYRLSIDFIFRSGDATGGVTRAGAGFDGTGTVVSLQQTDIGYNVPQTLTADYVASGAETYVNLAVRGIATGSVSYSAVSVMKLLATAAVDCLSIINHNLGTLGVTVELVNDDTATTVATFTPTTDAPFVIIIPEENSPNWTVNFITASEDLFIGVATLGKRLVFPEGVTVGYRPINTARQVTRQQGNNSGAHVSPARVSKTMLQTSALIQNMPAEFVDNDMFEFNEAYDYGQTFTWASGPSLFPDDVALCWADADSTLRPTQALRADLKSIVLQLEGFGQ